MHRRLVAVALALPLVVMAAHARAELEGDDPAGGPGWRLAVGPVVGGLAFDQKLSDYRWDTRPTIQSGVQATLYRGWFASGLRVWRARTTQASGIPGETQVPRVNLTGVEIVGQVRVVRYGGIEVWGSAHGGSLHMGYDPDQLTFDPGGAGGLVTVAYKPISEWDLGLGLELRRLLTSQIALAVQAERSTFALNTAHRRGDEIVASRERFYGWSLRLQLSWLLGLG